MQVHSCDKPNSTILTSEQRLTWKAYFCQIEEASGRKFPVRRYALGIQEFCPNRKAVAKFSWKAFVQCI